ncbi:MAG: hypothetical protein AB7U20_02080, partial [Planctomycetaceae bacterium]
MSLRSFLLVLTLAVALTVLFWAPLWQGGGLIGGDLYSYFFPQKTVYAAQLSEGALPLWNRLVGFGYPLLAESQAGVLYPPNPLLYRWFNINTAYNVTQIAHYVLAFVFTWLFMRRLGLFVWGATLGAVVFVYGWFPPRICLEWAIIGGVYLPLGLWCTESYLQAGRRVWLLGLAAALGVHLLAGHFNLAFITQLTVLGYATLRVVMSRESLHPALRNGRAGTTILYPVTLAVACSFALSAGQLFPTWELKQLSQREEVGSHHDPGYGHIPPWYLSQIIAPWMWYTADSDPDQALNSIKTLSIPSATNKIEAHLYFGLLPLSLIVCRLLIALLGGEPLDRRHLIWLLIGLSAMVYATGWLLPITRHLPGFSFFMGPGRYGIVTTLAAGLLSGAGLDRVLSRRAGGWSRPTGDPSAGGSLTLDPSHPSRGGVSLLKTLLAMLALGLTLADLHWVSRRITYAVMVPDPPINHREESEVRRVLWEYERRGPQLKPVRIWAPGANVASLTGFPATPVYLGLGPAAYFDPEFQMPEPHPDAAPRERREALDRQREWLRAASVTHILQMEPLNLSNWPDVQLVWEGFDRLLNPAWGRFQQPLFLYELSEPEPYARLESSQPGDEATVTRIDDRSVEIETSAAEGVLLTIAQLNYPGWHATIDGENQPT